MDKLAKSAFTANQDINCYISNSDVVPYVKSKQAQLWRQGWECYRNTHYNQYSKVQQCIFNLSIPRIYLTTLIRIIFGHACYLIHLLKIKIQNNELCDHCDDKGTMEHIFIECNKHKADWEKDGRTLVYIKKNRYFNLVPEIPGLAYVLNALNFILN